MSDLNWVNVLVRGSNRSGAEFQTTRQYVQTPSGMQATDPPTAGRYPRILYETQDGHNHFHLQKIARYSLWNQARTAEVAPGQKVGFCLEDTQRRETTGPANPRSPTVPSPLPGAEAALGG